jgi:hypothetical protein
MPVHHGHDPGGLHRGAAGGEHRDHLAAEERQVARSDDGAGPRILPDSESPQPVGERREWSGRRQAIARDPRGRHRGQPLPDRGDDHEPVHLRLDRRHDPLEERAAGEFEPRLAAG